MPNPPTVKTTKSFIIKLLTIVTVVLTNTSASFGQTPEELFAKGREIVDRYAFEFTSVDDYSSFLEGLKMMEDAYKKDKKRADWCREIGRRYYYNYVKSGKDLVLTAIDEQQGLKWFKKGAELGDLESALALFNHYKPHNRFSTAKEKKFGRKYAEIALKCNIPSDFNHYLTLSRAAKFLYNYDLAASYAAKAADNGEIGALDYLLDFLRALDYLTSPEAMYKAADKLWVRNLNEYVLNERCYSLDLYEKSAKAGYAPAQCQMGDIHLNGLNVKGLNVMPDTLKAISWYKLAAKNNIPRAAASLGRLYINGKGVERDIAQGFQFFNEGADTGHVSSIVYLGYCHLYGIGTTQDTQKARALFQKCFNSLARDSNGWLHIIIDNRIFDMDYLIGLTYYFENSPLCITLFESSLESDKFDKLHRGDLLRKLAACYQEGKNGVESDPIKAKELLKEAEKYGDCEITNLNIVL